MKLKFVAKNRPTAVERRQRHPREVVLEAIKHQVASIEASEKGETYTVERERYVSVTENGRDRRIKTTVQAKPKPWWWREGEVFYLQVRFGTHLVQLEPGKPTIECGKSSGDVVNVLKELQTLVKQGNLDRQIEEARAKAKRG